jgi:hypothetical protein
VDDADARRKLDLAYDYYGRFQNVFTGPGIVEQGVIKALPLKQSKDDDLASDWHMTTPIQSAYSVEGSGPADGGPQSPSPILHRSRRPDRG